MDPVKFHRAFLYVNPGGKSRNAYARYEQETSMPSLDIHNWRTRYKTQAVKTGKIPKKLEQICIITLFTRPSK
jgi:uncharacterized lipoprotein YddW (UPF0748 family)